MRVGKLENGKAPGEDEVTGEGMVMDWIWRLWNMTFENGEVSED